MHYDSPDRRGIDCALLYRRGSLNLLCSGPRHLYDSSGAIMRTRDILLAEFEGLEILVNHHPSKVGADSERRRAIAMRRMTALMDSLESAGHRRILACGDFNDDVWIGGKISPLAALGRNDREGVTGRNGGRWKKGTIKYNGAWEKIDGYFAQGSLGVLELVFDHPSLTEEDRSFGGTKPHRSFSGPRWLGGVSDHYPVVLWLSW